MKERVRFGVAVQIPLSVELDVEVRRRVAILPISVIDEVLEWIDTRCRDVGILLEIKFNVEVRQWAKPARGSVVEIVRRARNRQKQYYSFYDTNQDRISEMDAVLPCPQQKRSAAAVALELPSHRRLSRDTTMARNMDLGTFPLEIRGRKKWPKGSTPAAAISG